MKDFVRFKTPVRQTELYGKVCTISRELDLSIDRGRFIGGSVARIIAMGQDDEIPGDIDIFFLRGSSRPPSSKTRWLRHELTSHIQVVASRARDLTEYFPEMDFTVCQFVTDGREVLATREAIIDSNDQMIRFVKSNHARGYSADRILKYHEDKKFNISAADLLEVMERNALVGATSY